MTDDGFSYCRSGSGVRIYIVDTGVFQNDPEFEFGLRVDSATALTTHLQAQGIDFGKRCWEEPALLSSNANHGTSVASIAAGEVFGVAKSAMIVDARALPCNPQYGTAAEVYAVLDWIPTDPSGVGASKVVNMSFEFLIYDDGVSAIDEILSTYVSQNPPIVPVAAAGNSANGGDSWWTRPAQSPGVISAGGLNSMDDTKWQFSNHRVDLYAPAQFVESATYVWGISENRYLVRSELGDTNGCPWDSCTSGTSFAAPVVSGIAARVLNAQPGLSAQWVEDYIVSESLRTSGNLAGPTLHRDPVLNFPPSGATYPCQ